MRSDFPLGDWSKNKCYRVPFTSSEKDVASALQAFGDHSYESIEDVVKTARIETKHFLKILGLRCKYANGALNLDDIPSEDRSKVRFVEGMKFPVEELEDAQKRFREEYRADVYEITIRKIGSVDSQGKLREENDKK